MTERIAVVAGSRSRGEALAATIRGLGWRTVAVEPSESPPDVDGVVVDVHDEEPSSLERMIHLVASMGPVLAVGDRSDLPSLENAVRAGAADLAVAPDPAELSTRLRLLTSSRKRERFPDWSRALRTPAFERTRILVVEDDDDVRELLADLLGEAHDVFTAPDAEEGLATAVRELPDAILLDLFLPGMNGFEALRILQSDPRTLGIPVLFLSAHADERSRVRGLELGAADFVVKPFSAGELLARVDKTLKAARQGEHLRALAATDALTGLPNFRALVARLEEEIKRAERYRHPLSVVMVDLDNLKTINDRLGHAAGNAAIVLLGNAIGAQLRETDFAARYGGDEFVLILPHARPAEARGLAERIRRAMHGMRVDGMSSLRGSFGVASLLPDLNGSGTTVDHLLRAADAALYRAKHEGRDRVCVANSLGVMDAPAKAETGA